MTEDELRKRLLHYEAIHRQLPQEVAELGRHLELGPEHIASLVALTTLDWTKRDHNGSLVGYEPSGTEVCAAAGHRFKSLNKGWETCTVCMTAKAKDGSREYGEWRGLE